MERRNSWKMNDDDGENEPNFTFLSWTDESWDLVNFLKLFQLPRVVRLLNPEEADKKNINLENIDLTQPLLLFKSFTQLQVHAKCIKFTKRGKWKDSGAQLSIPHNIQGWFSVVSEDGRECAMMMTSLYQLTAARVPAFLTKYDLPVLRLITERCGGCTKTYYGKSFVKGGSVLRLVGICSDLDGRNISKMSLGILGGKILSRTLSNSFNTAPSGPHYQYVQCLSQGNEPLFIPLSSSGSFYPVAPKSGSRNIQQVYPFGILARTHPLPIKIKMICGTLHSSIPNFTGNLELLDLSTESFVLSSTLLDSSPHLFELPSSSSLLLTQNDLRKEDLFAQSTSYQSSLHHCITLGQEFINRIRTLPPLKKAKTSTLSLRMKSSLKNSLRLKNNSSLSALLTPGLKSRPQIPLHMRTNENNYLVTNNYNEKQPYKSFDSHDPKKQPYSSFDPNDPKKQPFKSFDHNDPKKLPYRSFDPNDLNTEFSSTDYNKLGNDLSIITTDCSQNTNHIRNDIGSKRLFSKYLSNDSSKYTQDFNPMAKQLRAVFDLSEAKNPLRRAKSFSTETQTVSLSLIEDCTTLQKNDKEPGLKCADFKRTKDSLRMKRNIRQSMSYHLGNYGKVVDEIVSSSEDLCGVKNINKTEDENIYDEIGEGFVKLKINGISYNNSNYLIRGEHMDSLRGGGSDGAFSGTFSSSNPSSREEDIYDNVF